MAAQTEAHDKWLTSHPFSGSFFASGDADDTVTGDGGSVAYFTNGGNDIINALGGYDRLYGGAGNDTLNGGEGDDYAEGGLGVDRIFGNAGNDYLVGGGGQDTLTGGAGDDLLLAMPGGVYKGALPVVTASYADDEFGVFVDLNVADVLSDLGVAEGSMGKDQLGGISNIEGSASHDSIFGSVLDNVVWGGSGIDEILGNGGNDTLYGDDGNDDLNGGAADDTLIGGGGEDLISDGVGNNTAYSGDGADIIGLGAGADFAAGGNGSDYIETGEGNDTVRGGEHGDGLYGQAGNDNVNGDNGDDVMYVDVGKDTLDGGAGRDTILLVRSMVLNWQNGNLDNDVKPDTWLNWEVLRCADGTDRIYGDDWITGREIVGDKGNDYIAMSLTKAANDTLIGGDDNDTLFGGAGSDTIQGGLGNDSIDDQIGNADVDGGDGNDILFTSAGADTLNGGLGYDTIALHEAMLVDWQANKFSADIVNDSWVAWEVIQGSAGNDTVRIGDWGYGVVLAGGGGNDYLATSHKVASSDVLRGEAGNDTLEAGSGFDTVYGGTGDDLYIFTSLDQMIESVNAGTDTVNAFVNCTLAANIEALALQGTDDLYGVGNASNNAILGNSGNNDLAGGAGNDTINDGAGDATVDGGLNDDVLFTSAGVDNLNGGDGRDTIQLHKAMLVDWRFGNFDVDIASESWSDWEVLQGSAGNDTIYGYDNTTGLEFHGGDGHDHVAASETSEVDDLLFGDAGNDTVDGGFGDDTMVGGLGNDVYVVVGGNQAFNETVVEAVNAGIDSVRAYGSLVLHANVEHLALFATDPINGTGNVLANRIVGSESSNILNGAQGNDTLIGGAGADYFAFTTKLDAATNVDTLPGFDVAADTIRLGHQVFTGTGPAGNLAPGLFRIGAAAGDADDRIIYNSATGEVFYDKDGTGASAQIKFAQLAPNLAMTNMDFQVA